MKPFSLVGVDGNAFNVMGYTANAMKKAGYTQDEIKEYQKLATSGDYNQLLVLSMEWIDKCNEVLGLESKAYGIQGDEFAKFGPGKYFIGDICYAMPDEKYGRVWGDKYDYDDGFYEKEGFAVYGTAFGDGCFEGTDGRSYGVDAGVLGIVDIGKEQRYDDAELNGLGKIVEVKDSLIMNCDDNGNFEFIVDGQSFEIITDGSNYEEEEEDYEEDYEEE